MPLFESGSGIQLTNLQYCTVHSSGMRASVSYNTVVYNEKHTIPTESIDLIILQIIITDCHFINIIFCTVIIALMYVSTLFKKKTTK